MTMPLIDVPTHWLRLDLGTAIIKRTLEKMYDDLLSKCFGVKTRKVVRFGY